MPSRNPERPKPSKPFKDLELKRWKTPGTYGEGGGLYFQVRRSQKGYLVKSWIFRYRDLATGKLRNMGIGSCSNIELKLARQIAKDQRELLRKHKDPLDNRVQEFVEMKATLRKKRTFAEAAEEFWKFKKRGWSEKHGENWLNGMKKHAYPILKDMQVSTIKRDDIINVLRPLWPRETGTRLRERMETVFAYAKEEGWIKGDNPAVLTENMKIQLGEDTQEEEHQPALPFVQVSAFIESLRPQRDIGALPLEFTILTAVRSGETRGAIWQEFDLEKGVWDIPKERMKKKKAHFVPLSLRALEILKSLPQGGPKDYVFPGVKEGKPISDGTMMKLVKSMDAQRRKAEGIGWEDAEGRRINVHGFRSSFSDWAREQPRHRFEELTIEHALAHQLPDPVKAAYARGQMLEKRVPLMNAWDSYCANGDSEDENVIPIQTAQ